MAKNTQARKWQITINNPLEKGFTHERIKAILTDEFTLQYWCMCDEIGGNENTYHTHIYLYSGSAIRFETIKKRFDGGHFEMCKGTSQENRDYIRKEGKYLCDAKADTNLKETFEEFGEVPLERQGARIDLTDLYDMIKDGMTNAQIIDDNPQFIFRVTDMDRVRQTILEEKYKKQWRSIEVEYIYGATGTGKTRGVMEQYGYENVYRVTDYEHPFDGYQYQDVIIFEEFRSDLKIKDMLKYLDGYPIDLPCRYSNKTACFTKIYIITNIHLYKQYPNVQTEEHETFSAFLRRIKKVTRFNANHSIDTGEISNGLVPIFDDSELTYVKDYTTISNKFQGVKSYESFNKGFKNVNK